MIIPPKPTTVRPNAVVTFSCLAWSFGGLVYGWNRNNDSTLPSNSTILFQNKMLPADTSYLTTVYELQIVNVNEMDEGLYCCEASNECGSNKECAWLEVDSMLYSISLILLFYIPYSGKLWRWKTLANLTN